MPADETPTPIPVIFDTDIGTDIDDTWALALILASPEIDLKLVVTDSGDTRSRARVAAKFLEACGRGDIPVGVGLEGGAAIPNHQESWAAGYDLGDYPGPVLEDGVGAMIEAIQGSEAEIVLLAVGPVPNVEEALRREPRISSKARVVAMSGSVDRGYGGATSAHAEYNVRAAPQASRAMYAAGWDVLLAPLDTAGQVQLRGELYQRLVESVGSAGVSALLENYRIWAAHVEWGKYDPAKESSVLFDALAVALVYRPDLVGIRELALEVTDDGFTRRSAAGSRVRAALTWAEDSGAFEKLLVERLLSWN